MKEELLISVLVFGIYANSNGQWVRKSEFPIASRATAFSFSIGNKGYVGTGGRCDAVYDTNGVFMDNKYTTYKDFWEFDASANVWTKKTDFPGGRRGGAISFSIGNKGYAGMSFYRDSTGKGTWYKDLWEYDPINNAWTKKTDFPDSARISPVCFTIGTKAYIGLGENKNYSCLNDFWEYDTQTNKWRKIADYPGISRFGAVAFSIEGKGYVGAGEHDYEYPHDFWEYDPNINQWDPVSPLPGEGKSAAIAFVLDNKGYVGTGMAESTAQKTSDFYVYDPNSSSWFALLDTLPCDISNSYWVTHGAPSVSYKGRMGASSLVINNKAYVGFGNGTSMYDFYNDFYEYTPLIATSIKTNELESNLNIFPNPNSSVFVVNYKSTEQGLVVLKIYNVLGECVYSKDFKNYSGEINEIVDLTKNGRGIYQLEIINGEKKSCKSIVVQ